METAFASGLGALLGPAAAGARDTAPAKTTFLNPILSGDHPDAGGMRRGEDYYLTHSSSYYAFLCEHKRTFYIYYSGDRPIRVIHAPSIQGSWSAPIALDIHAIDPSHVVDPATQKRYLHCSGGQMAEMTADGLSMRGQVRKVFDAWPIPREWLVECESPYNPIIRTRSRGEKWWSQGRGRLVDTPDGSWWVVYHAYENGYQTLGRQTMLMPVEWTRDGWYRVPAGLAPDKAIPMPRGGRVAGRMQLSDDFRQPQLGLQWQFWRDYDRARFHTGDGRLILEARGAALADTPVMASIAGDHAYEVEVDVEIDNGCEAGLVLFYSPERAIGMRIDSRGVGFRGPEANSRGGVVRPGRRAILKVVNNRQDVRLWYRSPDAGWEAVPHGWEVSGLHHNVLGASAGKKRLQ